MTDLEQGGAEAAETVAAAALAPLAATAGPTAAFVPPLFVRELGNPTGPTILFVHGSILDGEVTWGSQRPLGAEYRLVIPDRRNYGGSPDSEREDFERDAVDVVNLLDAQPRPVHLVGHSYGGIVALLAAARRPDAIASLVAVEPPAFGIARGSPPVEAFLRRMAELWSRLDSLGNAEFLGEFSLLMGGSGRLPDPLPPSLVRGIAAIQSARPPWEAEIPYDLLRERPFARLVVSGDHEPAFEVVCDVLEHEIGASRAVVRGRGHGIPQTGAAFNEVLEPFVRTAEARRG